MWHALGGRGHTESGIGLASVTPELLIDEASLSAVCATLACEAFAPEL
jgi:hypothetical protein